MPLVLSLCWTILAVEVLLLMRVVLGEMVNPLLLKRVAKWIAALGGVVLQNGCVTYMHLRAIIYPSYDLNWLVGPVHFIEDVV